MWAGESGYYTFKDKRRNPRTFSGKPVESAFSHKGKYLWISYYRRCYDINAQQAFRITAFNGTAEDITDFYADLSGADTGLDFDPVRGYFVAWDKGPRVWRIDAPMPLASAGWTVTRLNTTTSPAPVDAMLDGQTGTLGKWKYASDLDCFVGAIEPVAGNVWAFKPEGWQDPRSA